MIYLKLLLLLSSFAEGKLIDVPDDTEKPVPDIICFSIPWYKVTIFFLVNYVAHAATILPFAGQPSLLAFLDFLTALLLPYSGLLRGVNAIYRSSFLLGRRWKGAFKEPGFRPKWKKFRDYSQIEEAARAGALAVIIRSELWLPLLEGQGVKISASSFRPIRHHTQQPRGPSSPVRARYPREIAFQVDGDKSPISTIPDHGNPCDAKIRRPILPIQMAGLSLADPGFGETRRVHGLLHLPDQFTIAILPYNAKVKFNGPDNTYHPYSAASRNDVDRPYQHSILASTYNLPRVVVGLFQVFFALCSLVTPTHRAEIDKYGFAAFSLTLLPYLIMSLTNLTANIFTASYSALYLVRSEEMNEAERCGAKFDGVVGVLDQNVTDGVITATYRNRCYDFNELPAEIAVGDSEGVEYEFSPFACSPFRTTEGPDDTTFRILFCRFCCNFLALIPLAVIGKLTNFKGKQSAKLDQISTMLWFGMDYVYGLAIPGMRRNLLRTLLGMDGHLSVAFSGGPANDCDFHSKYSKRSRWYLYIVYFILFIFCGPSVWGFYTVVNMLYDWGTCYHLKYP